LSRNAGLLVLNNFSMGLGPGYRRLFVECLRDYARGEEKPIFLSPLLRHAVAVERVVGRLHIRRGCQN
jgi:ABC-type multidrug transport system, ATPase component